MQTKRRGFGVKVLELEYTPDCVCRLIFKRASVGFARELDIWVTLVVLKDVKGVQDRL